MLSKFSVKKPYTVVVGIVLLIILGVVSFTNMTVDLLPSMNLPYALVMTSYPGASPEEVEEIVTKPVEQTMATVSNIKNIQSVSSENASTVVLEFAQTANMDSVTIEMRESLDQISGFWPDEVANPIIMKLNPTMMPILITAVSAEGDNAAEVSRVIEDEVVPEVESVEGVASVSATGSIEETVEITLKEKKVNALSDDIKAEMEAKVNEARSALDDAKAQVESGKSALASGRTQASRGVSQAESQMSVKSEELKQAQLEITEKMAELNVSETQVSQSLATMQAGQQTAQAQLDELKQAKSGYDAAQAALAALKMKEDAGLPLTPEEEAQKKVLTETVEELRPMMENYETTVATLEATIAQLKEQETQLKQTQKQLASGKKKLESMQKEVNTGALSLAEARGQLAAGQLEAAAGLGEAAAQLAAGESALQMQEAQMEQAQGQADGTRDIGKMLTVDTVKTLLAAQNFRMPAGYVKEEGIDYLIRVGDKFKSIKELKNLVLLDIEGIDPVKLSDVAKVKLVNNED